MSELAVRELADLSVRVDWTLCASWMLVTAVMLEPAIQRRAEQ